LIPPSEVGFDQLMNRFEQTGSTLPAADAHGHDAVARFPAHHFIGERSDHARTGHAKRMTDGDRKSTRLNSSHVAISYAVFLLQLTSALLSLHSFPTRRSSDLLIPPSEVGFDQLMNRFEQTGSTLPAADAHGHDAVARFPAHHFIGERSDHARTGHAKRMTD